MFVKRTKQNREKKLSAALFVLFCGTFIAVYALLSGSRETNVPKAGAFKAVSSDPVKPLLALQFEDGGESMWELLKKRFSGKEDGGSAFSEGTVPNDTAELSEAIADNDSAKHTAPTIIEEPMPPEGTAEAPPVQNTAESAVLPPSGEAGYYDTSKVKVLFPKTEQIEEMPLEEYVFGAVCAEMPQSFTAAALMAQSVASRTLAVYFMLVGKKDSHVGADVCTDPGHCQGYLSEEDYIALCGNNGSEAALRLDRIRNAVKATEGIVMLYGGTPIAAAFHASSGAMTASAAEVWGGEVPYLQSTDSHECEDTALAAPVTKDVTFSREEFIGRINGISCASFDAFKNKPFPEWVSGIERTGSGRVASVMLGNTKTDGGLLEKALGLPSLDFSVSYSDDVITFRTYGHGHGVGMSQYGAEWMGRSGASFYDILRHYYTDIRFGFADRIPCVAFG